MSEDLDLRITADGSPTLYSEEYGELYHHSSGAFLESRDRYVVGCRVIDRLRIAGQLQILDIGFGLGFNVALAVEEFLQEAPGARLEVVSLEKNPISVDRWQTLSRALSNPSIPPLIATLLAEGSAELRTSEGGVVSLQIVVGRAENSIGGLARGFGAVFLDPFSPGRNPELWTPQFLTAVRRTVEEGAILATYSAATRVKVALLEAGWRIGAGPAVGGKSTGTLASAGEVDPPLPALPPRELRRLERKARESKNDATAL